MVVYTENRPYHSHGISTQPFEGSCYGLQFSYGIRPYTAYGQSLYISHSFRLQKRGEEDETIE